MKKEEKKVNPLLSQKKLVNLFPGKQLPCVRTKLNLSSSYIETDIQLIL